MGGVCEDGQDELLRDYGEKEDAPKSSDDLGNEGYPVPLFHARVFELVAKRRAQKVVEVVAHCKVSRVGNVAHGGRELTSEVLPEGLELICTRVVVIVRLGIFRKLLGGSVGVFGGGILIGWSAIGAGRRVEAAEALFCLRQVTIIEGVGVHLHKQNHGVKQQEDLSRPSPLKQERRSNKDGKPDNLVNTLQRHPALLPRPNRVRPNSSTHPMDQNANARRSHHKRIRNRQMPQLDRKKTPDLEAQREPRVLHVAQHGSDAHDGQANPEEVEEAMEVAVVGLGVEVRDAAGEVDGWEDATFLLGAGLFAGGGQGLDGRGRIFGDGSRATTVENCQHMSSNV